MKEGPVSFIYVIRGRQERTQKTSRFCLFSGNSFSEFRNTLYDPLGQDGFGLVKTNTNTNRRGNRLGAAGREMMMMTALADGAPGD